MNRRTFLRGLALGVAGLYLRFMPEAVAEIQTAPRLSGNRSGMTEADLAMIAPNPHYYEWVIDSPSD